MALRTKEVSIDLPEAYAFLFQKARYKVAFGGRGAGRTWSFSRYMITRALQSKVLILCCREIQESVRQSIHRTLVDQIHKLELDHLFTIQERTIICRTTGSEFIFTGLFRNINKIKSLGEVDICDIEEAESISEESWQTLTPTIRKNSSEILVRFNTHYADDPTYVRFVSNKPQDAIVVKTSYKDNPYFNEVLDKERLADLAFRPTEYKNIWEGECIGVGRKVWPTFDRNIHVKNFDMTTITKPESRSLFFMAIDPAQHYYPACLWMAVIPKPEGGHYKWVYNEWPRRADVGDEFHIIRHKLLFTGTLNDLSNAILVNDGTLQWGNKIRKRGIDTRFAKGAGSGSFFSGDTQGLVSEWAKKDNGGLIFHSPYEKTIDAQRMMITKDMQWNTTLERTVWNEPTLYISPSCVNLITSLTNHRLEEDSEAESEKYKDMADCLRILYATIESDSQALKPPAPNYVTHGVIPQYRQPQTATSWMAS